MTRSSGPLLSGAQASLSLLGSNLRTRLQDGFVAFSLLGATMTLDDVDMPSHLHLLGNATGLYVQCPTISE